MNYILSIETSTTACSVALHGEGELLGNSSIYVEKSHSGQLGPMIRQLLESCDVRKEALNAVAVSGGPGSYTGLRIGCSMAKGICFSLGIPLIAVSTLEAMARQVMPLANTEDLLCPMLDARRMEVYTMIMTGGGKLVEDVHPLILEPGVYDDRLENNRMWFFGNGSDKATGVIGHRNALFLPGITTDAVTVGEIAAGKFAEQDFADVAYYEPFYLKEFVATKPKKRL